MAKTKQTVLERLQLRLGPEAVMGGSSTPLDVDTVSTGALGLDVALGVGGLPRGRVVEIYGPESSGKTTLCLHVIAKAQAKGLTCGFVDAEHALDMRYAEGLGVDSDALLLAQPDSGEDALNTVEAMVDEGVGVVVVDSVAALTPQAEIDGEMGKSHMGLQARLMSQALRKLAAKVRKAGCLLIFINQIRMKIGVMFGSPETTSGGNALKFYASVRLDIRRIGTLKQGAVPFGNRTRIKVVKNKLSPPFQSVELDLVWGEGFALEPQLLDIGVALGVLEKSGSWFSYSGDRLGQGRANVTSLLKDNPDLCDLITADIMKAMT